MAGYIPFNPNANDAFGFTDPSGNIPTTQTDWRWILFGGILLLVFVCLYQNKRIHDLNTGVVPLKDE